MPSPNTSIADFSPRSPAPSADSPEPTQRPLAPAAPVRRAAVFPDGFIRGLEAHATLPPRGAARPTSADARLPAPRNNNVVRQLDFSNIPVENVNRAQAGRGPSGRHRTQLTLDLSFLNESPSANLSPAGSVGEPIWTTSPDFSRRDSGVSLAETYRNPSTGTSPAGTRNPSTGTSPGATFRSDEFLDATQRYVHARHEEARRLIDSRGEDAVHALLSVATELLTRTEAPTPPSGGQHSPLWKEKVDNLDPAFLDKLPSLALARRLKNIYQRATSGIALFDPATSAAALEENAQVARFGNIQALTGDLLDSMMSKTTPELMALLGGEKRARLGFLKHITDTVERGLERRDFPADEPRYAAIAQLVRDASYDLRDMAGDGTPEDARRKHRTALTQRVIAALP